MIITMILGIGMVLLIDLLKKESKLFGPII